MKLFIYDPKTHEYKGSRPAQIVNGKELIKSAYATIHEPPMVDDGYIQVFNSKIDNWEIFEDHRQKLDEKGTKYGGTPYWLPEDNYLSQPRYMENIGPLPEGALLTRPEKSFEELKLDKLNELESSFLTAEKSGVVKSSLGFDIDATERSNRDINGLIDVLESSSDESKSTMFCAADNSFHEVTLDDLKTMKLEVIKYGQELYQKKWTYREMINNATSKKELDNININF